MSNAETTSAVIKVTDDTFQELVLSASFSKPVLVDFWAQWCPPCHMLSPVLDEIAAELSDTLTVAKIDVDANPRLAQAFQAQSIPMVVAIIGGQMVDAFLGAMPEAQVRQWIDQVLSVAGQLGVKVAPRDGAASAASDDEDAFDDLPPALAAARDAIENNDLDAAARALEKALADIPGD